MQSCPSDDTLVAHLGHELGMNRVERIRDHLDHCAACRDVIVAARGTPALEKTTAAIAGPARIAMAATMLAHREPAREVPLPSVSPSLYELHDEVARGGMGRLLRATDRVHGREVAIKELLVGHHELQARFVREALLTARLQHPSIVPIYQAGTWPDGEPFYAMKMVAGQTLAAAIRNAPTLAARLGLLSNVIAVCDAIAYAHSQRILHRDLKPDNILVGEFGETVVVDWGLAKDLGQPDAPAAELTSDGTCTGTVMGTPAYMPPEQACGEPVDERADIYALGAVLYHTLTSLPPYARSQGRIVDAVRTRAPDPIRSLEPTIAPELATIVERAMARDPAARYASAAELAAELRRFTAGKLVATHSYTLRQLVRRWIYRHRAVVTASTILVAALAIVSVVSIRRIVDERDRADAQRDAAEGLVNYMVSTLYNRLEPVGQVDLLDGVGAAVLDYYKHTGDDPVAGRADALEIVGEVALHRGQLDRADAAGLEAASIIARTAEFRGTRRGKIETLRGDVARGRLAHETAIARYQAALQALEPVDVTRARAAAIAAEGLGYTLVEAGRGREAERACARSLAYAQQVPSRSESELLAVHALECRALVAEDRGDLQAALASRTEALARVQPLVDTAPGNAFFRRDLGYQLQELGVVQKALGDLAGARASFERSARELELVVNHDPDNFELRSLDVSVLLALAATAEQQADDAAEALYSRASAAARALADREPANLDYARNYGLAQTGSCQLLMTAGKLEEALAACRRASARLEPLVAQHRDDASFVNVYTDALLYIAQVDHVRGRTTSADQTLHAVIALDRELLARTPDDHRLALRLSVALQRLASVRDRMKATDVASLSQEAVTIAQRLASQAPDDEAMRGVLATALATHGTLLVRSDPDKAIGAWREAAAQWRTTLGHDPSNARARRELSAMIANIATADGKLGKLDEAAALQRESLSILAPLLDHHPQPRVLADAALSWVAIATYEAKRAAPRRTVADAIERALTYLSRALPATAGSPQTHQLLADGASTLIELARGQGNKHAVARAAQLYSGSSSSQIRK